MKLKDRPLEWWKGRSYRYWCRADSKDTRKINYVLNLLSAGNGTEVMYFSSDDLVDRTTMNRIRNSTIRDIQYMDNEWYVALDY